MSAGITFNFKLNIMKISFITIMLLLSGSLWAQKEQAIISIQTDQSKQVISKHI